MRYLLLLSAVVLCRTTSLQAEPQIVELRLDMPVELSLAGGTTLTLLWREVADSRCPESVTCIWEGEVGGTFDVVGAQTWPVSLTRHHDGDERATATAGGLLLRLLEITPYPQDEAGVDRTDYRARLIVAAPGEDLPDIITAIQQQTWGTIKRQETGT